MGSRILASLTIVAAAPSLSSCAQTASPLSLTSATTPPDYASAIARARAARDHAAALRTPSALDFASGSDEAISDTLRQWAVARREATQEAHRAYAEALLAAPDPAAEAEVYGEIAEVWIQTAEDTRSALFAATPAPYRDDPSLMSAVQGATVYALRPLLRRVESYLAACERVLSESPSASAGRTCAAVTLRLKKADDPRGPSAAGEIAEAAPRRPILPTTRPKPCTFKGTLFTRGAVYESESGGSVVLPIERDAGIEVESLAVASAPGGRYKVAVSWPKAVEGYLQAEEGPLVLRRRVELGPDAVWAAEGDRVGASDARGATVLAARRKVPLGGPRGAVPPGILDPLPRRLFCHDLELALSPRASAPPDASPGN